MLKLKLLFAEFIGKSIVVHNEKMITLFVVNYSITFRIRYESNTPHATNV